MSVTKSLTGLLGETLVAEGVLNENAKVGDLVHKPEGYTGPRSYFEFLQTVQMKGTHGEAYYTVDSIGTPFAGGGFNATLRDTARVATRPRLRRLVTRCCRVGAMAVCGGSAMTTTVPMRRAVCTAKPSGLIPRQTW